MCPLSAVNEHREPSWLTVSWAPGGVQNLRTSVAYVSSSQRFFSLPPGICSNLRTCDGSTHIFSDLMGGKQRFVFKFCLYWSRHYPITGD